MSRWWRSWRSSWRTADEQVEWYLLPLRTRIQITSSIRRGEAAPQEHRAIALREAERTLRQVRQEGVARAVLVPLVAIGLIAFSWRVPSLREFMVIVVVTMVLWWRFLTLPIIRRGKTRLMRAIELNRNHPDAPANGSFPSDVAG